MSRIAQVGACLAASVALVSCSSSPRPSGSPAATAAASVGTDSATDDGAHLVVRSGTFQVKYRLDGVTVSSPAAAVDIPAGTFLTPRVRADSAVTRGQVLGTFRRAQVAVHALGTVDVSREALVSARLRAAVAPVAGIAHVSAQSIRVDSEGLDVVVELRPLQQLRYQGMTFEGRATVETVLGQRDIPCEGVWLEKGKGNGDPEASAGAGVHCRLPLNVESAAGLPAVLTLTSPSQGDVIAVPLVYIGLDSDGTNYIVRKLEDGKVTERPVVVGATDGVRRVISSGIQPGDRLVPVSDE